MLDDLKVTRYDDDLEVVLDAAIAIDGEDGEDGVGVLPGGLTGQTLKKLTDADFDTFWDDPAAGVPTDGTAGQVLAKLSSLPLDTAWVDPTAEVDLTGYAQLAVANTFTANNTFNAGIILPTAPITLGTASPDGLVKLQYNEGYLALTNSVWGGSLQIWGPGVTDPAVVVNGQLLSFAHDGVDKFFITALNYGTAPVSHVWLQDWDFGGSGEDSHLVAWDDNTQDIGVLTAEPYKGRIRNIYAATGIYEGGVTLASKYASISHTHTLSQITDAATKADLTYVNSQDALKANITYVDTQDALKASLTGAAFTGAVSFTVSPTAPTPTAPADNSTTKLATCAFVTAAVAAGGGGGQPADPTLDALAALDATAGFVEQTGTDAFTKFAVTSFGKSLIDDADATAARSTLGLVIGTNVQALDATLTALAALDATAGLLEQTGADTFAKVPVTAFAKTLLDDAANTNARTTLGLGTSATVNTGTSGATIPLLSTANTWTLGQTFTATATFNGAASFTHANGITISAGQVYVNRTGDAAHASVGLAADANKYSRIEFMTSGYWRWLIGKNDDAGDLGGFSGPGAAGSNFYIQAWNDDQTTNSVALTINRATLITDFAVSPTAPTPTALDNSIKLATTAYVDAAVAVGGGGGVSLSTPNTWTALQSFTTASGLGLEVISTDTGSTVGPIISFKRNSISPAVDDVLGGIWFQGNDSTPTMQVYSAITSKVIDVTPASFDAKLQLQTAVGSSVINVLTLGPGVQVGTAADTGVNTLNAGTLYENAVSLASKYLPQSSYTAADVLTKLLTVDGAGSGIDADLLDGQNGTYYLAYGNLTGTPTLGTAAAQNTGTSGANVPLLNGANTWSATQTFAAITSTAITEGGVTLASKYLLQTSYTAADVLAKLLTVDGTGSGIDADLLDAQSGAYYLAYANLTGTPTLGTAAAKNTGTSGNTVPLLDGANTWSATQTFAAISSTAITATTITEGGTALSAKYETLGVVAGINTQTASYTLVLADAGKIVEINNASANNLTVPLNSSVAFPINTRIDISQLGAGQTTIVATGGVTIRQREAKLKLTGQYAGASLYKRGTDEWVLFGDVSA